MGPFSCLPILQRSACGYGPTPQPTRTHTAASAVLQADALRVPWHCGDSGAAAFATARERVALPMHGRSRRL